MSPSKGLRLKIHSMLFSKLGLARQHRDMLTADKSAIQDLSCSDNHSWQAEITASFSSGSVFAEQCIAAAVSGA